MTVRVTNSFTNISPLLIKSIGFIEAAISDHKPIYLNKKAQRHKHPTKTITSRYYRYYNKEMFGNVLLDNRDWHLFWLEKSNPNVLWGILDLILLKGVDALCPQREICIREDQYPWVDEKLRLDLRKKNVQFT